MSNEVSGIGSRIAEARRSAELSQEALAALSGYSTSAIQAWEQNARHPRYENLRRLAEVLGRDVAWFYADEPKAAA